MCGYYKLLNVVNIRHGESVTPWKGCWQYSQCHTFITVYVTVDINVSNKLFSPIIQFSVSTRLKTCTGIRPETP